MQYGPEVAYWKWRPGWLTGMRTWVTYCREDLGDALHWGPLWLTAVRTWVTHCTEDLGDLLPWGPGWLTAVRTFVTYCREDLGDALQWGPGRLAAVKTWVTYCCEYLGNALQWRLRLCSSLLVRLGSFPACWRQANVTPIPKGPTSSSVANYSPISITSVLSKLFERLVSVLLGRFMERCGVLPTTQFAYRKGTCDALLYVSHTLQSALESGQEDWINLMVDPLIGSTISVFSISSVMWVLEVLCCQYWHSFYQTDRSTLLWMVVEVYWLMLSQECRMAVFCAYYCSSYTLLSSFPLWKTSSSVVVMTPLWWLLCHPQALEWL